MTAVEQYFHVVLFIMLYKAVITFKSVDETLVVLTKVLLIYVFLSCFYDVTYIFYTYFVLNFLDFAPVMYLMYLFMPIICLWQ